ncbi:L,D-transpeptidase family protein [Neobacillus sp. NPDC097160]|uniref:L,D-transpeptidase family protein n=1 Tax=Neobacillus sp. NPDC097160 TaxID=3364298 RepID=UPI003811E3CE
MKILTRIVLIILCGFMILPPAQTAAEKDSTQAVKNGWVVEQGKQYYYQDNLAVKGWLNINDSWYYFDLKDGAASTGWIYDKGKWYFLKSNGVMQTGWLLDDDRWYFLNSSGALQTGWLLDNNRWYYLNSSGAMQTGWLLDHNRWYYLNSSGAMQTGWLLDKNLWYYLNSSGAMQTGWLFNYNQWYYLNSSGAMQTGWIYLDDWYYLNQSGAWIPNTIADQFTKVSNNHQLILVTAAGYNTNKAKIRTFEKVDNKWFEQLNVDGFIGKEGFATVMSEGGKSSPRGKYTIGTAFGRYQNPGIKLPYRQITADDVWVDDSNSSLYNTWQKASENNGRWSSAERMDISAYNYGFVINYNTAERIPGVGSAIFFHVSSSYTLGCTATAQNNVISILKWLDPSKNPVIIQTPESELGYY